MSLNHLTSWAADSERDWAEQIDGLIRQHRLEKAPPEGPLSDICKIPQIPRQAMALNPYLERLQQDGLAGAARMHHGRCLGHMTSPLPGFMPQLARLVASLNQNLMKTESSGRLTTLEKRTLLMLHRAVFDLKECDYAAMEADSQSTPGLVTSGGTVANVSAMWCARKRSLDGPDGWWREMQCQGYRGAVVIGSQLMHYSFEKAMDLLGLGANSLLKVDVDQNGAMRLDLLDEVLSACHARRRKVLAIVGIAGSTDFGSIDPLEELAKRARMENAHFHVDAAWGGPLLFSDKHADLLCGIEAADTVTLDAHKQLLTPVGCGVLLYRECHLSRTLMTTAPYAVRPGSADAGRFTLEGSRPANVIYLHAVLHLIGRRGFAHLIEHSFERARALARRISARRELELLLEPVSNLVVFRYLPEHCRSGTSSACETAINELNTRLHKEMRRSGCAFLSRTERAVPGRHGPLTVMLRAVMYNPLCELDDVEPLLQEVITTGKKVEALGLAKPHVMERIDG
ncbi:group II decarboxylase [Cupriavidus basilensis OR16]|uniref:Group II decarboxylase n=1 Tax=Cupriavidus basilensis OR16 TaxID=1127483 RepID=H1RY12_9BURK|nr:aminotransferase class V-fold PLP-dependent enzyme [Cupriavidus basilensis]EHP44785.1 group II decarboxylase [Cupriavidus basilensis OR16]